MIKKDFIERQIEAISNTLAAVLFGKDKVKEILEMEKDEKAEAMGVSEGDILERMVKKYLENQNFDEAEKLINDSLNGEKTAQKLRVALEFYNALNDNRDKAGCSEERIKNGIDNLKRLYIE